MGSARVAFIKRLFRSSGVSTISLSVVGLRHFRSAGGSPASGSPLATQTQASRLSYELRPCRATFWFRLRLRLNISNPVSKLCQESQIVLVKPTDITDLVPTHAEAFDAQSEGKSADLFRVVPDGS